MILHQGILKYIFILIIDLFLVVSGSAVSAQMSDSAKTASISKIAAVDTAKLDTSSVAKKGSISGADSSKKDTVAESMPKKPAQYRYFNFGVDIYQPLLNQLSNATKEGYEFVLNYYFKRDLYFVAEGGWGYSNVNYSDLSYQTKNNFLRLGIDRSFLTKRDAADWDNMFIGFRLGSANVLRSGANYKIVDSVWGSDSGSVANRSFTPIWLELTFGVRAQLLRGLTAGWTMRSKFMLNQKSFVDLTPKYIAGYGAGDKNSVFDMNFYVSYSLFWKKKHLWNLPAVAKK
jgi:Domain of unknown function (DUF6048)